MIYADEVFMGICEDNLEDERFPYSVYLINQSSERIKVEMQNWGFTTDEIKVVRINKRKVIKQFTLPAKSFIKIEVDNMESFKFSLVYCFTLYYEGSDRVERVSFTVPRYLLLPNYEVNLAILNSPGLKIYPI